MSDLTMLSTDLHNLIAANPLYGELIGELTSAESCSTNQCMITHVGLNDIDCVRLKCGHCYDETVFRKRVLGKKRCIYCTTPFDSDSVSVVCVGIKKNGDRCSNRCMNILSRCKIHSRGYGGK